MKLFNKGLRTIQIEGGEISPQQVVEVSDTIGNKLLGLYNGEVISLEQATAQFDDAQKVGETEAKADDEVSEDVVLEALKAEATALGIDFHHRAGVEKLTALIAEAKAKAE